MMYRIYSTFWVAAATLFAAACRHIQNRLRQMLKSTLLRPTPDIPPCFVRFPKFATFATVRVCSGAGRVRGAPQTVIMRIINAIIIHATGNRSDSRITLADIRRYHLSRGWRDIGYHYIVFPDGHVERGRPISVAGAHCYGHNAHSIGVAYIGGIDSQGHETDTRTPEQKQGLLQLVTKLVRMYRCDVWGHRDFSPDRNHDGVIEPSEFVKQCPCFDAHVEYHPIYMQIVYPNAPGR